MTISKDSGNPDLSEDEQRFAEYGSALALAVGKAFEPWLTSLLATRNDGAPLPDEVRAAIDNAVLKAGSNIAALVEADVETPVSGPLEQLRRALAGLPAVLDANGFSRPHRDPVDSEMRPGDIYGLGPMSFMELGPEVHDAGIAWGAAKAFLHHQRHA